MSYKSTNPVTGETVAEFAAVRHGSAPEWISQPNACRVVAVFVAECPIEHEDLFAT